MNELSITLVTIYAFIAIPAPAFFLFRLIADRADARGAKRGTPLSATRVRAVYKRKAPRSDGKARGQNPAACG
jgi:hypothetical protein